MFICLAKKIDDSVEEIELEAKTAEEAEIEADARLEGCPFDCVDYSIVAA